MKARLWTGFVIMAAWCWGWAIIAGHALVTDRPGLALAACALSWFGGIALARPIGWLVLLGRRRRPSDAPLPDFSALNTRRTRIAVALANTCLRLAHPGYRTVIRNTLALGFEEATRRALARDLRCTCSPTPCEAHGHRPAMPDDEENPTA